MITLNFFVPLRLTRLPSAILVGAGAGRFFVVGFIRTVGCVPLGLALDYKVALETGKQSSAINEELFVSEIDGVVVNDICLELIPDSLEVTSAIFSG